MTYRSPPIRCLPKKRKPLSWWRRIVLGRKARLWYSAMIDQSPQKRLSREMWRLRLVNDEVLREIKRMRLEIRAWSNEF
jgi:hypothetical protein